MAEGSSVSDGFCQSIRVAHLAARQAVALFGDALDESHGVFCDFGFEGGVQIASVEAHWRSSPYGCSGRHDSHMSRSSHKSAGRRSLGSSRRHEHDHWNLGCENLAHDVSGSFQAAAGRVHADD